MGDSPPPTPPVLDELRKNILITCRDDPWGFTFRQCLGINGQRQACSSPRDKNLAQHAQTLVKLFSNYPECPRNAEFYDAVSRFLHIAYCRHHIEPVKANLRSWRDARGDLEQDKDSEDSGEIVEATSITIHDTVSTTPSPSQSSGSCFDTDPSIVSPCDTQLTTPDMLEITNQVGTLEIGTSKESAIGNKDELDISKDVPIPSIEIPEVAVEKPITVQEPPKRLVSPERSFGQEIQYMRDELAARGHDEKEVEWYSDYYKKCPEKSKLLHKIHLNFIAEDTVAGSVLVVEKTRGYNEVGAVEIKAQPESEPNSNGRDESVDSEIIYQSSESFVGASRVVDLVKECFARDTNGKSVNDQTRNGELTIPEAEAIQAARIWTDFVKLFPAYDNGRLSQEGTFVADLAVQISPKEVLLWLNKLERGLSEIQEQRDEVRSSFFVLKLSPEAVSTLKELNEGMSMAGKGFRKIFDALRMARRSSRGKSLEPEVNSPAFLEHDGDQGESISELPTSQTQTKPSRGLRSRVQRASLPLKKAVGSFSSSKRSAKEKEYDRDIHCLVIRVGVLLLCNVAELKEMEAWTESENGYTVMDRFFASYEKLEQSVVEIV